MTAALTEIPTEDGVYTGIPDETYHADRESLSSSGARKILWESPAAFHEEQTNGRPPKKEYDVGHLVHFLVLGEGAKITVLDPAVHGLTAAGKPTDNYRSTANWKAAEAEVRDRGEIPVTPAEYETARRMADQLLKHPLAAGLLSQGDPEITGYWHDATTGVRLRWRGDWIHQGRTRLILVDYKGLALDTPIPTPTGWSTMGALRIGDTVFGSDGLPCQVTAKSEVHLKNCYRITFDDATSIVADHDHLWATSSGKPRQERVLTTSEISRTLRAKSGQRQHRITVAEPLETDSVMLPVDPYVLGAWLGDGSTADGKITSNDDEQWDLIEQRGYRCSPPHSTNPDACPTCTVYGLRTQLRHAGFLGNKHIPDIYLRAPIDQRLELLRGLMDTDGSCNPLRHSVVFTSTNKALAEAVRELALTLGERAVLHTVNGFGFGNPVTCWRVTWNPQRYNPFALTRKSKLVDWKPSIRSRQRVITSCDRTITVPTQCITVDSADSTYLCGDQMVPTHNTTKSARPASFHKSCSDYRYHQQEAWYRDGAIANGLDEDPLFLLIAQEKEPPFLPSVHESKPEDIARARALNRKAIDLYAACRERDDWPGYGDGIHTIQHPTYAIYREEDMLK